MSVGISGGESEIDLDGDVELDVDVDMDFDADLDGDVEADVDSEIEADSDLETGQSLILRMLSVLGVGRVPLSIILMTSGFLWGFFGYTANLILHKIALPEAILAIPSIGATLVLTVVTTRIVAIGVHKIMPTTESYATSSNDLIGRIARVKFDISEEKGTATLRDKYKNLLDIDCRVKEGEAEILKNSEVVILKHDPKRKVYLVGKNNLKRTEII
jgi:hypothetical protein